MRKVIAFILALTIYTGLEGKVIRGKVVDALNGVSLKYSSLGLLNTAIGTITNEQGEFVLETGDSTTNSIVRFSMIGYESASFSLGDLLENNTIIKLTRNPIQIEEVVVSANRDFQKKGTTRVTYGSGVSGWGGNKFGRGHETGLKIDLGQSSVKIHKLTFRIFKQSFDSAMLRLHIRDLAANQPNAELMDQNILFTLANTSGWVEFDISQYNIYLKMK